ncbi:MAG: PQQ-binding-like beta-propeller repeat protein [Bacteroidales bacterium]|nr:PQQ-binding-like beta-propeller repeat protein [Bacteroidales bacterium]
MNEDYKIKLAANTAIVASIFSFIIAMLLLLNYYQLKANDPLELESMELLIERLKDEPNNEDLKQEIRSLDLLARKAFFTSQWQVKTGRYLLLLGSIVWVFALRYYFTSKAGITEPDVAQVSDRTARTISQRWILMAGGAILLTAFLASFAVNDHIRLYQASGVVDDSERTADESIEVIAITESPDADQDTQVAEEPTTAGDLPAAMGEEASGETGAVTARANHNGFRGPFGNGVSYHKNIPVDWDGPSGRNIIWKAEMSKPGYNSPVLWKDKLFIAGGDKSIRIVYCFDASSGALLWQQEVKDIPGSPTAPPRVTEDTGLSAPTLATDGTRVYAIFATGDIIAFTMTGTRVWARNLGVPDNHYGHSSSLIVWNNHLLVQYDSNKGGRLLSLDTATGNTQWETARQVGISWASPIIANIGGDLQVVLSAEPLVAGYRIDTGEELWSVDCMMGEVGPSPAYGEGLIYAANEYARLVAINPAAAEPVVWEDDEYLPEVASPVVSGGLLFIGTSYGVLVCYDARSGEKYWEEEADHGFYASPMVADGKLFAMDTDGVMHIYSISKEVKKLGTPVLGEKVFASPAFSEGRLYLRGEKFLYCIGNE